MKNEKHVTRVDVRDVVGIAVDTPCGNEVSSTKSGERLNISPFIHSKCELMDLQQHRDDEQGMEERRRKRKKAEEKEKERRRERERQTEK